LSEPSGTAAREVLTEAEAVTASDLTLLECDRALIRGVVTGQVAAAEAVRLRGLLRNASAGWNLLRIDAEVIRRAREPFPAEPLRTLDAIHLASALVAASTMPDLVLLTLDHRLRRAARLLGLNIAPA